MFAVRARHVLRCGGKTTAVVTAHMARDNFGSMDDLHRGGARVGFDLLTDQAMRHGVVVAIELDVIVDVDRGEL